MNWRYKQRLEITLGQYSGQSIDTVFSMYWPQNEHQTDIYGAHLCETPFEALILALRQTYTRKSKPKSPLCPKFNKSHRPWMHSPERMENALSIGAELLLELGTDRAPLPGEVVKNLGYYEKFFTDQ